MSVGVSEALQSPSRPHSVWVGTVVYAALHRTLRYRGEDTGLYAAALEDGTTFFGRRQPALYDAEAAPISPCEVATGSRVRVRYYEEHGRKMMVAVQVVRLAQEAAPFSPCSEA